MRRAGAAAGSALFFLLAPSVAAGLVPYWLTGWETEPVWLPVRVAGALLLAAGVAAVVAAFARFVAEGIGTPAPVAPPERLVGGGLYRHVRNPMYVAVTAAIAGQGLLIGRPVLLAYAAAFGLVTFSFVRLYEEPNLERRFGADLLRRSGRTALEHDEELAAPLTPEERAQLVALLGKLAARPG